MNRVIVITGSGRGIGAASALPAASQGHSVCVNYTQDAFSANRIVSQIIEFGSNAIAVSADVCQEQENALYPYIVNFGDRALGYIH